MLGFALFVCGLLLPNASAFIDITITQYLINNSATFSTLYNLLNSSGLASVLEGTGPFTLYAPTNAAFGLLTPGVINSFASDKLKLEHVLKYHVLSGFFLNPQIQDGMIKTTLNGETVKFENFANGTMEIQGAPISHPDVVLNNGVVHWIDNVMLPSTASLAEILLSRPNDFSDFVYLLIITDLFPALGASGPYTVFAPTHDAFVQALGTLPSFSAPHAKDYYGELAKAHVVNGTHLTASLLNGVSLTTLHGNTVTVSTSGGLSLSPFGVNVDTGDLKGINGVIHSIDTIMFPSDLPSA